MARALRVVLVAQAPRMIRLIRIRLAVLVAEFQPAVGVDVNHSQSEEEAVNN